MTSDEQQVDRRTQRYRPLTTWHCSVERMWLFSQHGRTRVGESRFMPPGIRCVHSCAASAHCGHVPVAALPGTGGGMTNQSGTKRSRSRCYVGRTAFVSPHGLRHASAERWSVASTDRRLSFLSGERICKAENAANLTVAGLQLQRFWRRKRSKPKGGARRSGGACIDSVTRTSRHIYILLIRESRNPPHSMAMIYVSTYGVLLTIPARQGNLVGTSQTTRTKSEI